MAAKDGGTWLRNQNLTSGVDKLIAGSLQFGAGGGFGRNARNKGSAGVGYAPDFDNYGEPQ